MADRVPDPYQQSLFVVANQTGQIAALEAQVNQPGAVSIAERAVHLQNVVTNLAGVSMLTGFVSHDLPSELFYGDRADAVRNGAQDRLKSLVASAKQEFARATGHYALIDAGVPEQTVRTQTRSAFSDFMKKYYGHRHYGEAQAYRRQLADNVTMIQAQPVSDAIAPTLFAAEPKEDVKPSRPTIGKYERLEVLASDERAGFLPASHREKTIAITHLDYLDNPDYKRGVANQLVEVFRHHQLQPKGTIEQGRRAVESISYELEDYLDNAIVSHQLLADLSVLINDCPNPRVTLVEEIGPDHPGFAVFARFIDIEAVAAGDKVPKPKQDPLTSTEFRWTRQGPGRRKVVGDQYTQLEVKPYFKERIADFAAGTTIGEARAMILRAIENEENRAAFFTQRLGDLGQLPGRTTFSEIIQTSAAAAEKGGRFVNQSA